MVRVGYPNLKNHIQSGTCHVGGHVALRTAPGSAAQAVPQTMRCRSCVALTRAPRQAARAAGTVQSGSQPRRSLITCELITWRCSRRLS